MPSTTNPRIIARNRKNAHRSTGPRTAAGKAVSRGNSLKHGLTANPAVGVTEDTAAFDGLLEDLCRRIGPMDAMELSQVRRIAVALWRLQRAERIETAAARQAVAAQPPPHRPCPGLGGAPERGLVRGPVLRGVGYRRAGQGPRPLYRAAA